MLRALFTKIGTMTKRIKKISKKRKISAREVEDSLKKLRRSRKKKKRIERLIPALANQLPESWGNRTSRRREEDKHWLGDINGRTPWFESCVPLPIKLKNTPVSHLCSKEDIAFATETCPETMRPNLDIIRWLDAPYKAISAMKTKYNISEKDMSTLFGSLSTVTKRLVLRNEEIADEGIRRVYRSLPSTDESEGDVKMAKRTAPMMTKARLESYMILAKQNKSVREVVGSAKGLSITATTKVFPKNKKPNYPPSAGGGGRPFRKGGYQNRGAPHQHRDEAPDSRSGWNDSPYPNGYRGKKFDPTYLKPPRPTSSAPNAPKPTKPQGPSRGRGRGR